MKLLLDENLSRRLVSALEQDFPGSSQVALMGLERSSDADLWQIARDQGFVLVTKDDDFTDLQALRGYPPKPVILRLGNCTNQRILDALRGAAKRIRDSLADDAVGKVELA